MKSKELIRQLQELDPTGEVEVFAPGGDINFCEALPWYYDGRPGILLRDPKRKGGYDVAGMRQITAKDEHKIYLKCLDLDDVAGDNWEEFDKLILEGDEQFMARAKKAAEEMRLLWEDTCRMGFININVPDEQVLMPANKLGALFQEHKAALTRHDFNALGSSIRDKQRRFWKECVKWENGLPIYLPEFEQKDYNPPKS